MAIEQLTGQIAGWRDTVRPDAGKPGASGFGEAVSKLTDAVESTNADANTAVRNMLDGTGDVHEAMIALQRADLTLQLTVQVKNRLVNAYHEIMRMPV